MHFISSRLIKIFYYSTIFLLAYIYINFQLNYYPENITQDFYYQVWMLENWKYMTPSGLSDNFYFIINYLNFLFDPSTFLKIIASISSTITSITILYKSRNFLHGIFKILLIFSIPTISISYFCNTRFSLAQSIVLLIFVKLDSLKEKNNFLDRLRIGILSLFSLFIHIFTLPLLLIPLLPKNLNFSENIKIIRFKLKNIFYFLFSRLTKLKLIIFSTFIIFFSSLIIFFESINDNSIAVFTKLIWYFNNAGLPQNLSILLFPIISIGILYQNLRKNKLILEPSKILFFIYLNIPLFLISAGQTSRFFNFALITTIAFMPKISIPYLWLLLSYTVYLSYIYY